MTLPDPALQAAAEAWKPHRILSNGEFDWGDQKERDHLTNIIEAFLSALGGRVVVEKQYWCDECRSEPHAERIVIWEET